LLLSITILISGNISASDDESAILRSNGLPGLSGCYSAQTLGRSRFAFSFLGSMAYDENMVMLVVKSQGSARKANNPQAVLYDLFPSASYGITDFIDFSVQQPFYFDVIEGVLPTGGTGDLELTLKGRIPGKINRSFTGGLATTVTIPYSPSNSGYFLRHAYYIAKETTLAANLVKPYSFYSNGSPGLTVIGLATVGKKWFELHGNAGVVLTFNSNLDNACVGATGVSLHPAEHLSFSSDLYFEPRINALLGKVPLWNEPLHWSVLISLRTPAGALLTLGSKLNISSRQVVSYYDQSNKMYISSRMEPLWKTFLQFSWRNRSVQNDRDKDMIPDGDDQCPDVAEDIDSFQDSDGCPDFDNDNDNIPDTQDSCMNSAEDIDGFEDTDGCPDYDNDKDNIPDSLDACPDAAEDMDGFEDADGCPDFDNDKDNVPDSVDICPLISEDRDNFEDNDGCPDYDNDMDAIPDSIDKCPDSTGIPSNNGCSEFYGRAKEIAFGRLILPGVMFDDSTDELIAESYGELDRLYSSLIDWPEVVVEIQSHTDNIRSPEKSMACSVKRADAVLAYLVRKGVASSRIKLVSKGSTVPIADNAVEKGRLLNNRIEIHRIK